MWEIGPFQEFWEFVNIRWKLKKKFVEVSENLENREKSQKSLQFVESRGNAGESWEILENDLKFRDVREKWRRIP